MRNKDVNTTRTNRPRVLVYGYLYVNLGDDLLLRILAERYPSVDFYLFTSIDYARIVGRPNLHIIRRNRLNRIFSSHLPYQFLCHKFDAVVYIGGSIFIEKGSSGECTTTRILRRIHRAFPRLPIHIVGCNYGTEQTLRFRQEVKSVFEFVESVCVRDRYSYDIFASSPRISYAPDVVFNLSEGGWQESEQRRGTALSVIDLTTRPLLAQYADCYEDMMTKIVVCCAEKGGNVKLLSFCRAEGDMEACERIVNKLPQSVRSKVEIVAYEGDIDGFLAHIRSAGVLYATRFHATILGAIFGVPTLPIVYSDKTRYVLDDIEWSGDTIDVRQPREDYITLRPYSLDKQRVDELRKMSSNQFAALDKFFARWSQE